MEVLKVLNIGNSCGLSVHMLFLLLRIISRGPDSGYIVSDSVSQGGPLYLSSEIFLRRRDLK